MSEYADIDVDTSGGNIFIMIYKNKNIRFHYSVMFWVFVFGTVMMSLALLLLVGGLISAALTVKNVQPLDTVLQASGNHAGKAAYFDIVEPPVFLGEKKKEHYYLLTDGKEYRIAELDSGEYKEIQKTVEATGSYHIHGLTHYIVGHDIRREIASEAQKLTYQKMTEDTMDSILGDVCIEYMTISFGNEFKHGFGMIGIILGIVNVFIFLGSFFEMRASRKVTSLSGITAKDMDDEANKAGSVWLDGLRIYITENMILGIISDGRDYWGQVALRYDEIQRIYGYNKAKGNEGRTNYVIEAVAADGNKYTLSDNRFSCYSDDITADAEELFTQIKVKNPDVLCEPENVKYKTYKFSYILVEHEDYEDDEDDEDNEELAETVIVPDKQNMIMSFENSNPAKYFKPADAILSMKMSFPEEGIVEITTGYFGEREKDVEPTLYDFLKSQQIDVWDEDCEYTVGFRDLEG